MKPFLRLAFALWRLRQENIHESMPSTIAGKYQDHIKKHMKTAATLPACGAISAILKIKSFLLTFWLCSQAQINLFQFYIWPSAKVAVFLISICPLVLCLTRLFIPVLPWDGAFKSIVVPYSAVKGHSSPMLIQAMIWNPSGLDNKRLVDTIASKKYFASISVSQFYEKDWNYPNDSSQSHEFLRLKMGKAFPGHLVPSSSFYTEQNIY